MRRVHAAVSILLLACLFASSRVQAQAVQTAQLTKAPELIEFVEAPYPESELSDPRPVEVVISLVISQEGSVTEAQVTQSAGAAFDEAALVAVRAFVFSPAEFDGKPAPVKLTYRYAFASPPPPVVNGSFTGVLRAQKSGEPIAGAVVQIPGHDAAITDEAGRFSWSELPAGRVQVSIVVKDADPLVVEEEIQAGQTLEARYEIVLPEPEEPQAEDDLEVVVRAPPTVNRQVVSTQIDAEQARKLPGTQGDVLKVVESMPGVARASAGSGDVVVWGAAPGDTRTYVGAVRVPALYHFGGLRSVFHGDLVRSVELVPGGYGAPYGRGLGGLILVETKAPQQQGWHGSLQADLLDASASVSGPLSEKTSASVSARKSYIAELGSLLSDESFEQYFTIPSYYDGAARVRHQLSENQWIEFGGLVSGDAQERTQPSANPALRTSERKELAFQRIDIRYERETGAGERVLIAPWYGHDFKGRSAEFPDAAEDAHSNSHLGGLRVEYANFLSENIASRTGIDIELVASQNKREGALTSPPREGDPYIFGRSPASQLAYDSWSSTVISIAPYYEIDAGFFNDRLHVVPGIRFEPYIQSVSRARPAQSNAPDLATLTEDVSVEPRLLLDYAALPNLSFKAAAGIYRQPPAGDDLSAVFGNPTLNVARSAHMLFGVALRFVESVQFEATAFHTRAWDLGSRNASETPRVAEALVQSGDGRVVGGQFLLRKEKADGRFYGWVAYTLSRSLRRSSSADEFRLFDLDQTHVVSAVASYDLGLGFEVGVRARVATGFPRTPVTGAYYDTSRGRDEPLVGELNTIRIPTFYQFDARVSKTFVLSASKLEIYLDVQNVTNRQNPEEIAYSPDYSEQRFITGLPILPVLGARLEF
jgi:TonB family protein